jgi:CHAD domain-containing protein
MAGTDPGVELLASRYLAKQLRRLRRQFDGIRANEDVEPVHQARVASRRLRASLGLFDVAFRPKQLKAWRKSLRRLLKGLGPARDRDVQLAFVRATAEHLGDDAVRPGVERLALRLGQERADLQPKVLKAVDRIESDGALDEMQDAARQMRTRAKKKADDCRTPFVLALAGEAVLERLGELRAFEPSLADPEALEEHHAMRIAAKKLRYTMETCRPAYEDGLKAFIAAGKELQTLLGNIHDCDVWADRLRAFRDEERARTIDYFGDTQPFAHIEPGIAWLIEDRRRTRADLFDRLVKRWRALERRGTWDKLVRAVTVPADAGGDASTPDNANA